MFKRTTISFVCYELICDVCGRSQYFESDDQAEKYRRKHKWKSFKKEDRTWAVICRDCQMEKSLS